MEMVANQMNQAPGVPRVSSGSSSTDIGGLVGYNNSSSVISNGSATGSVGGACLILTMHLYEN